MQALSFKNTPLFKRGIWLSAAALTACVAVRDPPNWFGVCALAVFLAYLLWRTRIHRLADEVIDCEDRLKIRRGRKEEVIPFSNIAAVDASTGGGIPRITLRLRKPTRFKLQVEFLPQASLWGNPSGLQRLAAGLTERANLANGAGGTDRP